LTKKNEKVINKVIQTFLKTSKQWK
jgi:hypothetical protein